MSGPRACARRASGSARAQPSGQPPRRRTPRPRRPISVEVEPAGVGLADLRRDQIGAVGRHDDAAADLLHEPRRLRVGLGGDEHRAAGGEDAVEPARHDEAGEALREPDVVEIARQRATRRVGRAAGTRETARRRPSSRCDSAVISTQRAPKPMIGTMRDRRDPGGTSRRRRALSRFCAWPTLPECMTTKPSLKLVLARPGVGPRLRSDPCRVDPVRDHA